MNLVLVQGQPTQSIAVAQPAQPHTKRVKWGMVRRLSWVLMLCLLFSGITNPVVVEGSSMEPTLHDGEFLLVSPLGYWFNQPQRGDIVVFHDPTSDDRDYIKRIIGLPGELIALHDGTIWIDGNELNEPYLSAICDIKCPNSIWQLGNDEYFMLGDNREYSSDSRRFGAVPAQAIIGKAILRYYPFPNFSWIR